MTMNLHHANVLQGIYNRIELGLLQKHLLVMMILVKKDKHWFYINGMYLYNTIALLKSQLDIMKLIYNKK
jgi:hypothetical protein